MKKTNICRHFISQYAWRIYTLLILLTFITYLYYLPKSSGIQNFGIRPFTQWMHGIYPSIIICVITAICITYYKIRKHEILISGRSLIYIYIASTILYLTINPWAFNNIAQLSLSSIFTTSLFLLSYVILKKLTFIIWPSVFFLSLFLYAAKTQGILLTSDKLMQIFCTSWQDAQFYFTFTNIFLILSAICISIIAWYLVYHKIHRENKSALSCTALLLLLPALGCMYALKKNISVDYQYVWPLGIVQQFAYESKKALISIKHINELVNLLPQDDNINASIAPLKQYEGIICILHIGESVSANHLSINGYNRNTTPWLSKQTNLINFKDCIASAIVTDRAVLTILTNGRRDFLTEKDPRYLPSSPSLVDFFKVCGFKCATFWDNSYLNNTGGNLFAKQVEYFNRKADSVYGYPEPYYMEQLKDVYDFTSKNKGKNQFLLINNFGSHAFFNGYNHNDPPFRVSAEPQPDFTPKENKIHAEIFLNAYDSTIHQTDKYIESIAKHLEGKPFIYIFISDHGEYLGDNGFWQRNQAPFEQFHQHEPCKVPFFIVYSPEFEAKHPHFKNSLNQLKKNQTVSTAHEHLFHTLLGLMNIETPYYDTNLDLTKPNVKPYTGPHPDRKGQTLAP